MELSKTGVYRAQMSYHRVAGTRRGTKQGEAMWHKAKKRSDEFLHGVSPRQGWKALEFVRWKTVVWRLMKGQEASEMVAEWLEAVEKKWRRFGKDRAERKVPEAVVRTLVRYAGKVRGGAGRERWTGRLLRLEVETSICCSMSGVGGAAATWR